MSTGPNPFRITIIGGGITGLSAAYYLERASREENIPIHITLVEKTDKLGGKIATHYRDGFIMERGPDSFLSRKTPMLELSRDLGLEKDWVATRPESRKTYILQNGQLLPMPSGLMFGIPTELWPFLLTDLLSFKGKLRAGLDLVLPRKKTDEDESLGHFLERRLGPEIVATIAEPLLSGIYAGDAYSLSLRSTFPQFEQMELQNRSLILSMLKSKGENKQSPTLPQIARDSVFLSFRKGLSSLVRALNRSLTQTEVILGQTVQEITQQQQGYLLELDQGLLDTDAIIMTVPNYVTGHLLEDVPAARKWAEMPHVSVANVLLAYDSKSFEHPLDGSGFVVPRQEGRTITACTWNSAKWPHVAPAGKVLLRAYVGRQGSESIVDQDDTTIIRHVKHDLREIMGIDDTPEFMEVNRWKHSMPQYEIGHSKHLQELRRELTHKKPGIFIGGAGLEGVGLPDCVAQGRKAAEQTLEYIVLQPST